MNTLPAPASPAASQSLPDPNNTPVVTGNLPAVAVDTAVTFAASVVAVVVVLVAAQTYRFPHAGFLHDPPHYHSTLPAH
ncbi:hypothetical protein, partial [Nitrosomonas sp.]|uniref:hypothetical protein n=1 Tax=Nitrosomonas sp. TaxID=42353 RepID=UPI0025D36FA8